MLRLLKSREWDPDSEDLLLSAFRALDPTGKGYIEWERMKELVTSNGSAPFRDKETEQFQAVAKDLEHGLVYYEDYVAMLLADSGER